MKDYIMMIIYTSLFCAVIKILLPRDELGLSFAVKICVLCILLSPIFKWSGDFLENDFLVITEESEHKIDNEDADMIFKRWLAEATSKELSAEIEERLYNELGVNATVLIPWYEEGENILFDILTISADCSEEKLDKINAWVKIHYSLESVCTREKIDAR